MILLNRVILGAGPLFFLSSHASPAMPKSRGKLLVATRLTTFSEATFSAFINTFAS